MVHDQALLSTGMKLTQFWERMHEAFGDSYADSLARDHVFSDLGGVTITQALERGDAIARIWRVVHSDFNLSDTLR